MSRVATSRVGVSRVAEGTSESLGWTRLGVAALAIVALYAPMFPALVREWAEFPNLSHGFAVPFIAGYLLWLRRSRLAALPHTPSWRWLPLTVLSVSLYLVGMLGGETFLARISFPLTLLAVALFLSGTKVARELQAAIAFLLFMIPLPYVTQKALTDEARLFDAAATAMVLPWLGVPVLRDGYLLHLPNITLEVADVCSSIPAIASLLALGAVYGLVIRRPLGIRLLLLGLAVPLGIASNIVRIILTAIAVYLLGPIALQNVIHQFSGTVVFLMTLTALVVIDVILRRWWSAR